MQRARSIEAAMQPFAFIQHPFLRTAAPLSALVALVDMIWQQKKKKMTIMEGEWRDRRWHMIMIMIVILFATTFFSLLFLTPQSHHPHHPPTARLQSPSCAHYESTYYYLSTLSSGASVA